MVEPVDKDLFLQHAKHMDKRFDRLERRYDAHSHGDKVGWVSFVTAILVVVGIAIGVG